MPSDINNKRGIYVQMLGDFSANCGEESLIFLSNMTSTSMQLLLLLWYYKDTGISRQHLIDCLFGANDITNASNSLRVAVCRMKKMLTTAGFSSGECMMSNRKIYKWNSDLIEVHTDVGEFIQKAEAALDMKEEEKELVCLLKDVCQNYSGALFLNGIGGIDWIEIERVRLQELYFNCLRKLWKVLEPYQPMEKFPLLYELSKNTVAMYPYEEWYIMEMDCLAGMKQYQEAIEVYNEASKYLYDEFGLQPTKAMMSRFYENARKIQYSSKQLWDIVNELSESPGEGGAYFCNYPGFVDNYRLVSRILGRLGLSVYLMLCTLTDKEGMPLASNNGEVKELANKVELLIENSLRRGDSYTRYSANQYMILLIGIKREDCSIVSSRIDKKFKISKFSKECNLLFSFSAVP